jgi:hypothetical protein
LYCLHQPINPEGEANVGSVFTTAKRASDYLKKVFEADNAAEKEWNEEAENLDWYGACDNGEKYFFEIQRGKLRGRW